MTKVVIFISDLILAWPVAYLSKHFMPKRLYLLRDFEWRFSVFLRSMVRKLDGGRICSPAHNGPGAEISATFEVVCLPFCNKTKKTPTRKATKFRVPAHKLRIHLVRKFWLPRSKGQVTRQVKVRCALRDLLQTWRSCCWCSFSPNVFKLWEWNIGVNTHRMYISDFSFQWPQIRSIFNPSHYKPMGEMTLLPITFEPRVINEWNGYASIFLVPPNRMMPNMTNLTCDPKLGERSNFEMDFLGQNWVPFDSS